MGAFGVGPLENDDALDWLCDAIGKDVAKSTDKLFSMIVRKPTESIRENHWAQIVAAAALIAHTVKAQPKISRLLKGLAVDHAIFDGLATNDRINAARRAINLASEEGNLLRAEWVDSGLVEEWEKELQKLDRILSTT